MAKLKNYLLALRNLKFYVFQVVIGCYRNDYTPVVLAISFIFSAQVWHFHASKTEPRQQYVAAQVAPGVEPRCFPMAGIMLFTINISMVNLWLIYG